MSLFKSRKKMIDMDELYHNYKLKEHAEKVKAYEEKVKDYERKVKDYEKKYVKSK